MAGLFTKNKGRTGYSSLMDASEQPLMKLSDSEDDQLVLESIDLRRSRRSGDSPSRNYMNPNYTLIERKIIPGETLSKISLQYSIAVAELKRVNSFVNDQDFYARKFIKIPVKKYSHLEQQLLEEQTSHSDDGTSKRDSDRHHTRLAAQRSHSMESLDNKSSPNRTSSPTASGFFEQLDNHVTLAKSSVQKTESGFQANQQQPSTSSAPFAYYDTGLPDRLIVDTGSGIDKPEDLIHLPNYTNQHWWGSIRHFIIVITVVVMLLLLIIGLVLYLAGDIEPVHINSTHLDTH